MTNSLVLRYSHNVVEHLGLKLYQNKPTRVIAEIVSNSWDADSVSAEVNMQMGEQPRWVSVLDNGHGMDRSTLATSYLVVGHGRRRTPGDVSPGGRPLMGRKGIGKLAAFGIAGTVDVLTCASAEGGRVIHWLRFVLRDLLAGRAGDDAVSYKPRVVYEGGSLEALPVSEDPTGQALKWRSMIGDRYGTAVIMSDLSLGRAISEGQLLESLGARFTISHGRGFVLSVNGRVAQPQDLLPAFDFRVPATGLQTEFVDGHEVRSWAGFVRNADWPSDQAGVGVYAHGKIAQDRPFTFGIKGKEVLQRYMFAVVEADWLDELSTDVISTDRTSINWESPELEPLHRWGEQRVREWIADFQRWRQQEVKAEAKVLVEQVTAEGARVATSAEKEEIARLVSEIIPSFGKNQEAQESKERLARALSEAWVQRPMRRLVTDLWGRLGADDSMPPEAFTAVVEQLSTFAVPEALNLAVVFAQRAFALNRLHDYVHNGIEVNLQDLIERFPWIVEPDLSVLTADESLALAVKRAEELEHLVLPLDDSDPDSRKRPDFIFLASPNRRELLVVELKNPQIPLTWKNRQQLTVYMDWLEHHYPDSTVRGYLVGADPNKLEAKRDGVSVLPWTSVLERSAARNTELLAAMLMQSAPDARGDVRVTDAMKLGGVQLEELLQRLASQHEDLRAIMTPLGVADGTRGATRPAKGGSQGSGSGADSGEAT